MSRLDPHGILATGYGWFTHPCLRIPRRVRSDGGPLFVRYLTTEGISADAAPAPRQLPAPQQRNSPALIEQFLSNISGLCPKPRMITGNGLGEVLMLSGPWLFDGAGQGTRITWIGEVKRGGQPVARGQRQETGHKNKQVPALQGRGAAHHLTSPVARRRVITPPRPWKVGTRFPEIEIAQVAYMSVDTTRVAAQYPGGFLRSFERKLSYQNSCKH